MVPVKFGLCLRALSTPTYMVSTVNLIITVYLYISTRVSQPARRHAVACTSIIGGPCPCPGTFICFVATPRNSIVAARYSCQSCGNAAWFCASFCCSFPILPSSTIQPCSRVYELPLTINKYSNNTTPGANDTSSSPLDFADSPPFYPSPYVQTRRFAQCDPLEVRLTSVGKSEGVQAPLNFTLGSRIARDFTPTSEDTFTDFTTAG